MRLHIFLLLLFLPYVVTNSVAATITRSFGHPVSYSTIILGGLPTLPLDATKHAKEIYKEFMPLPDDLPVEETEINTSLEYVPLDFIEGEEEDEKRIRACSAPSPSLSANFIALDDGLTTIPPDTQGTVGVDYLMTTLNDRIRIQTKAGLPLLTTSLSSFWGIGTTPFDPRIIYDPSYNRWIFCVVSNSRSPNSMLLVAVSQTSNPLGVWNIYRIRVDSTGAGWADYPTLGFNGKWIVVQANIFPVTSGVFKSFVYAFDKNDLYSAGTGNYTLFTLTNYGGTQVPALTYDNISQSLYLLQNWNGNAAGKGYLRLYVLNGPVGAETLSSSGLIAITSPWASSTSNTNGGFAPQLGTATRIRNNDARIMSVVYRNGFLWTAQGIFLPATGPTHSAVQWMQLNPTNLQIQQFGRIEDPFANQNSGMFFAFPSLAVNSFNDVMIGYSFFSPLIYASSGYSFRYGTDPLNTLRCSAILQAGRDIYNKDFGSGSVRWGDYSNTSIDPNGKDFWTIQESADIRLGTTSRWLTWWGNVIPR